MTLDQDAFSEKLRVVISQMDSVEKVIHWLRSQPGVDSADLSDYLIKTHPPQKEVKITFRNEDGTTYSRILDIILYPDQTLGLAGMHEP
jgi:hypothetical protein